MKIGGFQPDMERRIGETRTCRWGWGRSWSPRDRGRSGASLRCWSPGPFRIPLDGIAENQELFKKIMEIMERNKPMIWTSNEFFAITVSRENVLWKHQQYYFALHILKNRKNRKNKFKEKYCWQKIFSKCKRALTLSRSLKTANSSSGFNSILSRQPPSRPWNSNTGFEKSGTFWNKIPSKMKIDEEWKFSGTGTSTGREGP